MEEFRRAMESLGRVIVKSHIKQANLDWSAFYLKLNKDQRIPDRVKTQIFAIQSKNLTQFSREMAFIKDEEVTLRKKEKNLKTFRNTESDEDLYEDFSQFERYVYDLIKTDNYCTKSRSKKKVYLGGIDKIYGYDEDQNLQELFQTGRLYLWEMLKKYGIKPPTSKNFKTRNRRATMSGKSTFVYGGVYNLLMNLEERSSRMKFEGTTSQYMEEVYNFESYEGYENSLDKS